MARRVLEQHLKELPGFLVQAAFGQTLRKPQPWRVRALSAQSRGPPKFLRGRDDVAGADGQPMEMRPARFLRRKLLRQRKGCRGFLAKLVVDEHGAELAPRGSGTRPGAHGLQGRLD